MAKSKLLRGRRCTAGRSAVPNWAETQANSPSTGMGLGRFKLSPGDVGRKLGMSFSSTVGETEHRKSPTKCRFWASAHSLDLCLIGHFVLQAGPNSVSRRRDRSLAFSHVAQYQTWERGKLLRSKRPVHSYAGTAKVASPAWELGHRCHLSGNDSGPRSHDA
jgi:hypothetical protein